VLAERRAQREQHERLREDVAPAEVRADAGQPDTLADDDGSPAATQATAAPSAQDADSVAAALRRAQSERDAAHEAAASLAMRIREDEQRRERARSMMAEIERQRAIEERWAKLAELIGSADGKKFRNYAQQFTLDVLLGYANTHLAQLARRYRLERVVSTAGPSLALMVRDQDMGGEVRSVNSLSGGESFLVSLALALGLASLSSNRVKVESLFIDEGFGSLDSDTLGVAMDALDALQSLGRKVGVISHVQEMTERIATKVLVRPAGGGSSAVTVQC
jgi:exonuclease SbcC